MYQEVEASTSKSPQQPQPPSYLNSPPGIVRENDDISKQSEGMSNVSYSEIGELERTNSHKSSGSDIDSILGTHTYCLGLSKRQWHIFTVLLIADFLAGVVYSIKGPFYPPEAELKGASATQYGLVFGIFELTKCLASPVYGHFMKKLGSRNVFNIGILTVALCSIFFGMLDRVDNATSFVTYSFLIRILEACGNAAFSTAAFTTIICEFPDSIATAFACFETTFGIGLIAGPMIGGVFFELGGYPLPFIVTGGLLFFSALFISVIMPAPLHTVTETTDGQKGSKVSDILLILSLPGVLFAAFAVLVAACSVGFINTTLEPHIRQFQLSPVQTALVFIIFGTVYAIFAPIWGSICDRMQKPRYVLLCGTTLNTIAFLLIGPAPFFNFDTYLWVTSLGLLLQGLGVAAVFVSGFILALKYSIEHGFPDNIQTYSVISGLWTSVTALGMFIGPSTAGMLLDQVGFRWGSLFLLVLSAVLTLMLLTFIVLEAMSYDEFYDNETQERENLLTVRTPSQIAREEESRSQSYGSIEG